MTIAAAGDGNHFVMTELMLAPDIVVLYDWLGLRKSAAFYKEVTGHLISLCALRRCDERVRVHRALARRHRATGTCPDWTCQGEDGQ